MKKIYSLFAVVVLSSFSFAQGSETFQTQTALTSGYANGTFAGETSGVTVNFVHARDEGLATADDYSIAGKGIMLRRADEPSSVEFVIPNGVGSFTFSYRKAFTSGAVRSLAVFVNNVQTNVIADFGAGSGADATVYTSTTVINQAGPVTVKISYPTGTATGNKQLTIDNVSWTANGSLAVSDLSKTKSSFVKNTYVKSDEITFGSDAKDVKIYTLTGQLVKTATVKANGTVNVAELAEGNYIVTGTVNNQAVSQKILKD